MRFDFALLADAAAAIEGKLYVQGGGVSRINASGFPWIQSLAVCMRVAFDADDDPTAVYEFEVAVLGPERHPIFGPHTSPITWQLPPVGEAVEGEERGGFVALTINALFFQAPGPHRVELAVGDARAHLSFAVVGPQSRDHGCDASLSQRAVASAFHRAYALTFRTRRPRRCPSRADPAAL